jgi:uncharacterized protein Usg
VRHRSRLTAGALQLVNVLARPLGDPGLSVGRAASAPPRGAPGARRFLADTGGRVMTDITDDAQDFRLTTAEILYRMPDYPDLIQSYLWQSLDRLPDFPKLQEFLGFWERELQGELHSVRIGYVGLIQPAEWHDSRTMDTLQ